ncbi:FadR/GntR family transcriptional regulator [Klebsiella sp. BIGb0407]|uniref:FadR/GntR family transcriptional regulator n=1 Tax=Klebsiella sp. BIGb0407 TaxID=2940603 RepID=UPI002168077E|nr:FadR/GntR family transcriptional regulator [Klebsiella sp. BIGb0407]
MNMKSTQKQNVVNDVFEQLRQQLIDGNWAPGSRLPSEQELCATLNVSRVSVRSAVQRLRDLGVVITRQGSGSYISEDFTPQTLNNRLRPVMNLSKEEFHDMMVFRQTVEFKCMELAVIHATAEDILALEQALNRMLVNKNDYKKYSEADFDFHLAIAKASQNKVFYNVMLSIKESYYYYLEELNRALGITLESVDTHIQVYLALKNRDASTAVQVLGETMAENLIAIERINQTEPTNNRG